DIAIEIRRGIAGTPVDEIERRVETTGQPGVASAVFPRIAGPAFRAAFAGLGNGVEAPDALTGLGIVGVKETIHAMIAITDSDHDLVPHGKRRNRANVAFVPIRDFGVPDQVTRPAVERHQVRILRPEVDAMAQNRYTPIRSTAHRGLTLILPNSPPSSGVESEDTVRVGKVHHAIDYKRHRLELL